jgi:hypothetical protein
MKHVGNLRDSYVVQFAYIFIIVAAWTTKKKYFPLSVFWFSTF